MFANEVLGGCKFDVNRTGSLELLRLLLRVMSTCSMSRGQRHERSRWKLEKLVVQFRG